MKCGKAHEQAWTSESYPVLSRVGPNSFLVEVSKADPRVWPVHALRAVPPGTVSVPAAGEKVNKTLAGPARAEDQGDSRHQPRSDQCARQAFLRRR